VLLAGLEAWIVVAIGVGVVAVVVGVIAVSALFDSRRRRAHRDNEDGPA